MSICTRPIKSGGTFWAFKISYPNKQVDCIDELYTLQLSLDKDIHK
jgi:hypothetical protein